MAIATLNPATGETVKTFDAAHRRAGRRRARARASDRSGPSAARPSPSGPRWMRRAADLLDEDNESIAAIMTPEMGKTLTSARGRGHEVRQGDALLRRARRGVPRRRAGRRRTPSAPRRAYARYQPLGPRARRHAVELPAVAGRALRRARADGGQRRPAQARVERAADARSTSRTCSAGRASPTGAFQTLLIGSTRRRAVLRDPRVAAATLTGSEPAGQSVAADRRRRDQEDRARARRQRPVRRHAVGRHRAGRRGRGDRPRARTTGSPASRPSASSCTPTSTTSSPSAFVARMAALTRRRPDGRGHRHRPARHRAAAATTRGARRRRASQGRHRPLRRQRARTAPGWFYPPTVVTELTPDMRMYAEEIFGPVAAALPRRLASTRPSSSPTPPTSASAPTPGPTTPPSRTASSDDLDAGAVFINGMTTSYPELPFGGMKRSGYGRELSAHGIREFCNIKAVWIG